jgi:hypothetical protein
MKTKHSEHSIILNCNLNIDSFLCALNTGHTFKFQFQHAWNVGQFAVHTMLTYRGVKVDFHTLLTLHCMEMSRQLHAPTTFPQERTRYPLSKRLCGPLSWSGCLVTVVNQYCLFCFILFILACVALLEVHLKISWHIYRDCKIKILVINRR